MNNNIRVVQSSKFYCKHLINLNENFWIVHKLNLREHIKLAPNIVWQMLYLMPILMERCKAIFKIYLYVLNVDQLSCPDSVDEITVHWGDWKHRTIRIHYCRSHILYYIAFSTPIILCVAIALTSYQWLIKIFLY